MSTIVYSNSARMIEIYPSYYNDDDMKWLAECELHILEGLYPDRKFIIEKTYKRWLHSVDIVKLGGGYRIREVKKE